MEMNRPFATVTPTLDGGVLAVLATHDAAFTTGQIRRILDDFSEEGIRKVLARLLSQGVVTAERVGHAYAYRFNAEHLAAEPIKSIAMLASTFLARLEELLEEWEHPPVYAAVFGSAARGAMEANSDIDLLLVRGDYTPPDRWAHQVNELAAMVTKWTGNDARVIEYTATELHAARGEPMVRDVLDQGLTVAGSRSWLIKALRPIAPGRG